MKITCNASLFADLFPFTSKEETRYYLRGIHVHPAPEGVDGIIMVATDAHTVLRVHDAEGTIEEYDDYKQDGIIVPIEGLKSGGFRAKAKEEKRTLTLEYDDKHNFIDARITNDMEEIVERPIFQGLIEGTFPDYTRIIPDCWKDDALCGGAGFDGRYLARFGDLTTRDAVGHRSTGAMLLLGAGPLNPHRVRFGNRPEIEGVIMPMRGDGAATKPGFWSGE